VRRLFLDSSAGPRAGGLANQVVALGDVVARAAAAKVAAQLVQVVGGCKLPPPTRLSCD